VTKATASTSFIGHRAPTGPARHLSTLNRAQRFSRRRRPCPPPLRKRACSDGASAQERTPQVPVPPAPLGAIQPQHIHIALSLRANPSGLGHAAFQGACFLLLCLLSIFSLSSFPRGLWDDWSLIKVLRHSYHKNSPPPPLPPTSKHPLSDTGPPQRRRRRRPATRGPPAMCTAHKRWCHVCGMYSLLYVEFCHNFHPPLLSCPLGERVVLKQMPASQCPSPTCPNSRSGGCAPS
jgi:hypothetical protein